MSKTHDSIVTILEAAGILGVSRSSMERWLKRANVPFLRIGRQRRFYLSDILTHAFRVKDGDGERNRAGERVGRFN